MNFDQPGAVHARVTDVRCWIGDLCYQPSPQNILLRGGHVAEQKCRDALFATGARSEQVMAPMKSECLDFAPGVPRHAAVVVRFEHPENGQNA
jgi:hypothetical protein